MGRGRILAEVTGEAMKQMHQRVWLWARRAPEDSSFADHLRPRKELDARTGRTSDALVQNSNDVAREPFFAEPGRAPAVRCSPNLAANCKRLDKAPPLPHASGPVHATVSPIRTLHALVWQKGTPGAYKKALACEWLHKALGARLPVPTGPSLCSFEALDKVLQKPSKAWLALVAFSDHVGAIISDDATGFTSTVGLGTDESVGEHGPWPETMHCPNRITEDAMRTTRKNLCGTEPPRLLAAYWLADSPWLRRLLSHFADQGRRLNGDLKFEDPLRKAIKVRERLTQELAQIEHSLIKQANTLGKYMTLARRIAENAGNYHVTRELQKFIEALLDAHLRRLDNSVT